MDRSEKIVKQTDDELLFCIESLPVDKQWRNIILLDNNGIYTVEIENYDSLEGRSHYKTVGRFSNPENAEEVYKKERQSLIFFLLEEDIIELDDSGNFVHHGVTSKESMFLKKPNN